MASATMSSDKGRRAALGLLAAAVVLAVSVIALPVWLLHRHYDAALAESANRLQRYNRVAATRPDVARQLAAMRGKETRKVFLRSGAARPSPPEAPESLSAL